MTKPNATFTVSMMKDYIRKNKLNRAFVRLGMKKSEMIEALKKMDHWDDTMTGKKKIDRKKLISGGDAPVMSPKPKKKVKKVKKVAPKKSPVILVDQDLKDDAKLKKSSKDDEIKKTKLYKELLKLEKTHLRNLIANRKNVLKGKESKMRELNDMHDNKENEIRKKYSDTKLPRSLLYLFKTDSDITKLIKEHDSLGKKIRESKK
tara:strand:+ start:2928 stop:3542 length:615 start_codon:yes stop_codon:yes gene_type:complete